MNKGYIGAAILSGVLAASCSGDIEDSEWTVGDLPAPQAPLSVQAAGEQCPPATNNQPPGGSKRLAMELRRVLQDEGFTGKVQRTLEARLGRALQAELAELGRLLWFDKITGLHDDNTCGGCHSPSNGFGDTQPIAIGIQNNNLVGPDRRGPRNQRRTPSVMNTAFFPKLMWDGRFSAPSRDPFDNSQGYSFPPPEGTSAFPPDSPEITHLLMAQAHIPPTELVEVAGFTGTAGTIGPEFDVFDDGVGSDVPAPDASGFRNEPIRQVVLERLNGSAAYRQLFGERFPSVAAGGPITFAMFAQAIAEFEFMLTFADAPIDRFARGDDSALSDAQKRGALLFFGDAGCSQCHATKGIANEMFSDFRNHVIAVPQIAPSFGPDSGNVVFEGPGKDEDFGFGEATEKWFDRYKFRTTPLRNVALQPAFFHNGAFTRLRDAIAHHLDPRRSARNYDPVAAGVPEDLRHRVGPVEPMLELLDPRLRIPIELTEAELDDLTEFVEKGLLDPRARPQVQCGLVPDEVPSGAPVLEFTGCPG
jgi:cytochrome c peroxidase